MKKLRVTVRDQGLKPGSKEEGHDDKQTGGTVIEPCLEQNQNSNPETGSKTTVQTGTSTNSRIGPRTDLAPSSSESQTIEESVAMNPPVPRERKDYRSHPLDKILTDLNFGVQTRSRLKNFCAFYAFLSNIEPKL